MDAERALLSKAVQSGQIEQLIAKGVDEDYFYNDECKAVWASCVGHLRKFRSPPSFDAVRTSHPEFSFEIVTDAFDYVYEEFVKQTKRRAAINGLREIAKAVDDPERVLALEDDILELGASMAQMFPSGNAAKFSDMDLRIDRYERLKDTGQVAGIPIGIPKIDNLTNGIRRHEFVSVVGWQGTGKSTLAQHVAMSAYLAGFSTLVVSLEMESAELLARFDAMTTNFQTMAMDKFELGEGDIKKWRNQAERVKNVSNDIVIIDDVSNCTVEKVHSIAQQYSPDLLIVDYVSLMTAPKQYTAIWEKVTYLTQGLKMIARDPDCPAVIGIAQTNIGSAKDGAQLENIAYSRSIGQDSDIVLGLYQDDEGKMKARNEMEVRMLKNRRGGTIDAKMFWNPARMEFREWTTSDMFAPPEPHSEENAAQ